MRDELESVLRQNLAARHSELSELWGSVNDHWGFEDSVYRFYHQSFKVYHIQNSTETIVKVLRSLAPDCELHPWFKQIIAEGTGKQFSVSDNPRWLEATRPIVEAFYHARFFLEMACRYREPPKEQVCPSGWAAILHLFQLW